MAASMTEEQKAMLERKAAAGFVSRLKAMEGFAEDYATFKKEVENILKDAAKLNEMFDGVDVGKVFKNIDEIRAKQEAIVERIRVSKTGLYIPGLGDEKDKFSIQRAAVAIVSKSWGEAGFEKEVFDQARKKATGHVVGVDSQGGFFVPDQIIPDVIQAIYQQSVLISLDGSGTNRVSVLNGLTGIPVTLPKFIGGMIAYWLGEQDKYVESAVKAGSISMRPRKLGVLTRITDEMRRFSSYGFESLMRNDMTKAAAALIDYTVVYGTGTDNMPRGVMNQTGTKRYYAETSSETPPSGNAVGGELTFDDLDNMKGVVEDQNIPISSSWAWIANPRFFRRLRQTPTTFYSGQTTGTGYLLGGPMLTDDALRSVIGDFGKSTALPSANNAGQSDGLTPQTVGDKTYGDVIGANWNDVIFGRWGGLEMAEDGGVGKGFPTDETYIKMRMYADVDHRSPESIVVSTDAKMR